MRLPRTKLWRAFPELDAYSDAECQRYIREASNRRFAAGIVLIAFGTVAGVALGVAVPALWSFVAVELSIVRAGINRWLWEIALVDSVRIIGLVGGPALGFFLSRDVWLRRAVRARLDTAKCGGCGYSLLGLTTLPQPTTGEDAVQCPECGQFTPLRRAGLTPGDLMQRPRPSAPPTSPPTSG